VHFFYNAISDIYDVDFEFEARTFEQYAGVLLENFKKSFPVQAWRHDRFSIEFLAGPISIKIIRSKPREKSSGTLRLVTSEFIKETFETLQAEMQKANEKAVESKSDKSLNNRFEIFWSIARVTRNNLIEELGKDFTSNQLFIPAGRSFFTSMGKAVVAFEHGGFLDPLTITFGQRFLLMRDYWSGRTVYYRNPRVEKKHKELQSLQDVLSEKLFFGKIKLEKNEEYLQCSDGRRIPFPFMSSGQQELLPLWLTLNVFFDGDSPNNFVYIEEPEAHLFPLAQGLLTEYFVTLLASSPGQKMLITTHSPYILSKINNLLKAGVLSDKSSKNKQSAIEKILPKSAWLKPNTIAAYSIVDRKLVSILDEDGLINGEYLDGISGDISREFNSLLEIEYAK